MKVNTTVHETRSVIKGVSLSTGGFVELELDEAGKGYLKVHLSKNTSPLRYNEAWRSIQFADDKKNIQLLTELRDAATAILESLTEGK